MAEHTVTITKIEDFTDRPTVTTMLGVEVELPAPEGIIRTTIDVDGVVTDHWHYIPVGALATRMDIYGLATEVEAIEALERELVRMWDPLTLPAGSDDRARYGGTDAGVAVVWATGVAKDAEALVASHQEELTELRAAYRLVEPVEGPPPPEEPAP